MHFVRQQYGRVTLAMQVHFTLCVQPATEKTNPPISNRNSGIRRGKKIEAGKNGKVDKMKQIQCTSILGESREEQKKHRIYTVSL